MLFAKINFTSHSNSEFCCVLSKNCQKKMKFFIVLQERCYPLFRRGPCAENQFLVFSKRTQKVKCSHNRCPDGEVRPRRSPECIALDTPGGPCNDIEPFTVLTVNETTLELHCAHIHTRHVIEAPLLNCSPGSRRDAAGKCRRSII